MVKYGESTPDQSEGSESFELVSPLSISAVEGTTTSMRMLGVPILLDLTRGSQRRKLTLSAHMNSSKVKNKSKSKCNFLWSSSVTRFLRNCKSNPYSLNSVF